MKTFLPVWIVAVFLVGFSFGLLIGYGGGRADMRNRAVKAGVAEWAINPATGARWFGFHTEMGKGSYVQEQTR